MKLKYSWKNDIGNDVFNSLHIRLLFAQSEALHMTDFLFSVTLKKQESTWRSKKEYIGICPQTVVGVQQSIFLL